MRVANGQRKRKGAALYMIVLSTSLIVSMLGIASMAIVRVERRQLDASNDKRLARSNASSAVELALNLVNNDPNWRATYTNGVETSARNLGSDSVGTLAWSIEDADGDLTNADTKLRIKGIGRVGSAVQVSSVEINFQGGMDCLDVAICSVGSMDFFSSSTVTTNQTIATNGSTTTYGGTIVNSDVEAVGSINGTGYMGSTTSSAPARTFPDSSVYDYYLANGTSIALSALPKSQGFFQIEDVVLSPTNNPFGATNAEGIYIIDLASGKFRIQNARIIGTLVLLNAGSNSKVDDEVSWEPAVANYPALLVQGGSFQLDLTDGTLSESDRGENFNPVGSPYLGGTDSDQADSYPSEIKGLIYGDGGLSIGDRMVINGLLIAGGQIEVFSGNALTVTYDPSFAANAPPGFGAPRMNVVKGSWLWDAAP